MYNGLFYSQRRNCQANRGMRTNANAGTRQQAGCNNGLFVPNNFQENRCSNQSSCQSSSQSTNCSTNHSQDHSSDHKQECCKKVVKEIRIKKCQDEQPCISNDVFLKTSAFGGIIIPDGTEKGTAYNAVSINLDTEACGHFHTELSFSCNVLSIDASARLRFQILKQEKNQAMPLPLSSGYSYFRNQKVTESDVVTFSVLDCDSHGTQWCNYSVFIEIVGQQTAGAVMITNPVLIAAVVEKNQENHKKGDIHDQKGE
ncbi:DUF4489 domain-containing protein [uncultured Robinsoniella sp.]|uniref:DUF4489 domain-containing protein n=1 Tax=uncultured Robinsoniella sp. TaxID=904190 RepID=UPI00374E311F